MRVGMELGQADDFSATLTREDFTKNLAFLPTAPTLRTGYNDPLAMEETIACQRKLGGLRWAATVPRKYICARLAKNASRINSLRWSDVYCIKGLAREEQEWQKATASKSASFSDPWKPLGFAGKAEGDMCDRGEKFHCGTMSLVGWSGAVYNDLPTERDSRLVYVIGSMSSSPTGPCQKLQWTSKLARQMVKSSLDGEVFVLSEMVDHKSLLRDF